MGGEAATATQQHTNKQAHGQRTTGTEALGGHVFSFVRVFPVCSRALFVLLCCACRAVVLCVCVLCVVWLLCCFAVCCVVCCVLFLCCAVIPACLTGLYFKTSRGAGYRIGSAVMTQADGTAPGTQHTHTQAQHTQHTHTSNTHTAQQRNNIRQQHKHKQAQAQHRNDKQQSKAHSRHAHARSSSERQG